MTVVSCYGRESACGFETGSGQVILQEAVAATLAAHGEAVVDLLQPVSLSGRAAGYMGADDYGIQCETARAQVDVARCYGDSRSKVCCRIEGYKHGT